MRSVTLFHVIGKELLIPEGTDYIYARKSGSASGFCRDYSLSLKDTTLVPIRQVTTFNRSSCRTLGDMLDHEPPQYGREAPYVGLDYSDCDVFSSLLEEEFEERTVNLRVIIKDLEIKNQTLLEECEMLRTQLGSGLILRCKSHITPFCNWCVKKWRGK
jgi:hypothetical protein